jgi:uncharacterized protein involved in exopolysaccharide biosynthesis
MEEMDIHDYVAVLKRRRGAFLLTAVVVFSLSVAAALLWSNYRSTVTVQIQRPDIPESVTTPMGVNAAGLIQALADQRVNQIQQRITSTAGLVDIIIKLDLYPDERRSKPMTEIVDTMRKKIKLEMVSADLANPSALQRMQSTQVEAIAFTISFDYSDPLKTQQTVDELITRFLDEDLKQRRVQAKETSQFLAGQAATLEATMVDQERRIAAFRADHTENRPEALAFNQQMAATTALNIQNVDSQIAMVEKSRGDLLAQLAVVDPYSRVIADGQVLTTPAIQLKALQAKYSTALGQYGETHPDVVKLRRQIEGLQGQLGQAQQDTAELHAQINQTRARLSSAEKAQGADHPDVKSLRRELAQLEAQLGVLARDPTRHDILKADADNPAYLMLVAQSNAVNSQYAALVAQRGTLHKQLEKYQRAVAEAPAIEQQFAALTRDYDNIQLRFREIKEKKMAADMSEQMEQGRKGERLEVINPPELPTDTRPKRILIIAAGLVLSGMAGAAVAGLIEMLSRSVRGTSHLASLTGMPALVVIPHIYTQDERTSIRRQRALGSVLGGSGLLLILLMVNYLLMPLDVMWGGLLRKFGLG